MPKVVSIVGNNAKKASKRAPDVTDEQREKRLCDLALTVAEERMRNGTATSAEICHFLRIATEKSKQEQEELRCKTELLKAKTQAIADAEKSNVDYAKVIEALTRYSGKNNNEVYVDEDY